MRTTTLMYLGFMLLSFEASASGDGVPCVPSSLNLEHLSSSLHNFDESRDPGVEISLNGKQPTPIYRFGTDVEVEVRVRRPGYLLTWIDWEPSRLNSRLAREEPPAFPGEVLYPQLNWSQPVDAGETLRFEFKTDRGKEGLRPNLYSVKAMLLDTSILPAEILCRDADADGESYESHLLEVEFLEAHAGPRANADFWLLNEVPRSERGSVPRLVLQTGTLGKYSGDAVLSTDGSIAIQRGYRSDVLWEVATGRQIETNVGWHSDRQDATFVGPHHLSLCCPGFDATGTDPELGELIVTLDLATGDLEAIPKPEFLSGDGASDEEDLSESSSALQWDLYESGSLSALQPLTPPAVIGVSFSRDGRSLVQIDETGLATEWQFSEGLPSDRIRIEGLAATDQEDQDFANENAWESRLTPVQLFEQPDPAVVELARVGEIGARPWLFIERRPYEVLQAANPEAGLFLDFRREGDAGSSDTRYNLQIIRLNGSAIKSDPYLDVERDSWASISASGKWVTISSHPSFESGAMLLDLERFKQYEMAWQVDLPYSFHPVIFLRDGRLASWLHHRKLPANSFLFLSSLDDGENLDSACFVDKPIGDDSVSVEGIANEGKAYSRSCLVPLELFHHGIGSGGGDAYEEPTSFSIMDSSDDGRLILVGHDSHLVVVDTVDRVQLSTIQGGGGWHTGDYFLGADLSPDGKMLATAHPDGSVRLWHPGTGAELATLVAWEDGRWAVIAPSGQFDSSSLEEMQGLHWVVPDDWIHPVPFEIFMRQYYEPRLLNRLLNGETFDQTPDIASLNRVQPEIEIVGIERKSSDSVRVTVAVTEGIRNPSAGGEGEQRSGVFDLRLFRDGQLVGQFPSEDASRANIPRIVSADRESTMTRWREEAQIKLEEATGQRTIVFESVRLPHKADLEAIEFSAYAFNVDQVKSATARKTFTMPKDLSPRKGRAYVVTFGVNRYDDPRWDLRYAANDARRLAEEASQRLRDIGSYQEIVAVSLVSVSDAEKREGEGFADKESLRTVLDLLAGREVDVLRRAKLPMASRILEARPEDLLLVAFASHGYADGRGNFYLLPHGIGQEVSQISADVLGRSVSSDELSLWMRDVDAGDMAMIIDACHSAASVEGEGFKPGPMGSRGLGQLAYDKGIRILAASQTADYAREFSRLGQGLLSFALVKEGLEQFHADHNPKDGVMSMSEWLEHAAKRVPELHAAELGSAQNRGVIVEIHGSPESAREAYQQPALFDFTKGKHDAVLARVPQTVPVP